MSHSVYQRAFRVDAAERPDLVDKQARDDVFRCLDHDGGRAEARRRNIARRRLLVTGLAETRLGRSIRPCGIATTYQGAPSRLKCFICHRAHLSTCNA
jgi:hypothetical protein